MTLARGMSPVTHWVSRRRRRAVYGRRTVPCFLSSCTVSSTALSTVSFAWAYRRSATAYDVAATLLVAGLDPLDQLGDLVVDLSAFGHQRTDLFHSMDDSGVVATAELAGDGGIAEVGELSCHVHRDLT